MLKFVYVYKIQNVFSPRLHGGLEHINEFYCTAIEGGCLHENLTFFHGISYQIYKYTTSDKIQKIKN
jgi:hypothetical protein